VDGPDDVAERVQGPLLGQLILARFDELLCQESKISRLMAMSNRSEGHESILFRKVIA